MQTCSDAARYTPPLSRIPLPPFLPSPRCISTSRPVSSAGAFPSDVFPPGSEAPQGLAHPGGYHPGLLSEERYCLNQVLKKESGHPRRRSLPAEDARHPTPNLPCLGQVLHQHWSVVAFCLDHLTQVFKGGHHLQCAPIRNEIPGGDFPLLLRR